MDDFISRKATIDALFELYEYQRDIDPTEAADLVRQGIYLAEKKIEQLPSAQPEIIHCKECASYGNVRKIVGGTIGMCGSLEFCTFGDWYCGNAERRTDE